MHTDTQKSAERNTLIQFASGSERKIEPKESELPDCDDSTRAHTYRNYVITIKLIVIKKNTFGLIHFHKYYIYRLIRKLPFANLPRSADDWSSAQSTTFVLILIAKSASVSLYHSLSLSIVRKLISWPSCSAIPLPFAVRSWRFSFLIRERCVCSCHHWPNQS